MKIMKSSIRIAAMLIATGTLALQLPLTAISAPLFCQAIKVNNGHGNNLDGVDCSNPGESKESLDTNTAIDDESGTFNSSRVQIGSSCLTDNGKSGTWVALVSQSKSFRSINGQ